MQTPLRVCRLFAVLVALAAVSATTALLSGCSFSGSKSGPLPDAATLLKQSAATTKNDKSAHVLLTVTGKIAGLPLKTLTGDLSTAPTTAAQGNAQVILFGQDVSADFVVLNGELYTTALSGNGTWDDVGKATDLVHYDPSTILNPDNGVANLLANFTNPKAEGRENVAGQNTVRITGTVPADAVNKLASPFNATAPVPATTWIQESGDHQMVQASLEKTPGNSVQLTLSKWNAPVNVTKPATNG